MLTVAGQPQRDGALENDIVVHENTHGVSNRLTGGGTGRCLQTTEAGGMGEGWSDALADWTEKTSSAVPDFVLGQYVTANSAGIRAHPYSTSATTNPYRYSTVKTQNEVHAIGEVWANILHNVYAALITAYGFDAAAKTTPTSTAGNAVYLHLFLNALLLQPCSPTCAPPVLSALPDVRRLTMGCFSARSCDGARRVDPGGREPLRGCEQVHALEGVREPRAWRRRGELHRHHRRTAERRRNARRRRVIQIIFFFGGFM